MNSIPKDPSLLTKRLANTDASHKIKTTKKIKLTYKDTDHQFLYKLGMEIQSVYSILLSVMNLSYKNQVELYNQFEPQLNQLNASTKLTAELLKGFYDSYDVSENIKSYTPKPLIEYYIRSLVIANTLQLTKQNDIFLSHHHRKQLSGFVREFREDFFNYSCQNNLSIAQPDSLISILFLANGLEWEEKCSPELTDALSAFKNIFTAKSINVYKTSQLKKHLKSLNLETNSCKFRLQNKSTDFLNLNLGTLYIATKDSLLEINGSIELETRNNHLNEIHERYQTELHPATETLIKLAQKPTIHETDSSESGSESGSSTDEILSSAESEIDSDSSYSDSSLKKPNKVRFINTRSQAKNTKISYSELSLNDFATPYLYYLSSIDLLAKTDTEIKQDLHNSYALFKQLSPLKKSALSHHFLAQNKSDQFNIIYSFAIAEKLSICSLLLELTQQESLILKQLPIPIQAQLREDSVSDEMDIDEDSVDDEIENLKHDIFSKPDTENSIQAKEWAKIELQKLYNLDESSSSFNAIKEKLKLVSKIPYGITKKLPVSHTDDSHKRLGFLHKLRNNLDSVTYGQDELKQRLIEKTVQLLNSSNSKGQCLMLLGPPGTGKTTIIRHGLAKSLGMYFAEIPLAGIEDSSLLKGSGQVWENSKEGDILRHYIRAKGENFIFFFDEVDKIGKGNHGDAILQCLTQTIDFSQNEAFQDLFLPVPIDLSKCIFIFTANTLETIPAPLLDRMEIIEIKAQSLHEKTKIGCSYQLPSIKEQNGFFPADIHFSENSMRYLLSKLPQQAGARSQKQALESLVKTLGLSKFVGADNFKLPSSPKAFSAAHIRAPQIVLPRFNVTNDIIDSCLHQYKFNYEKVKSSHQIGEVNGLYATTLGDGGLLPIQGQLIQNSKSELNLTGNQGDIMKESMKVATTVVQSLITDNKLISPEKDLGSMSVHIHATDTAQYKDGPSAGGAIALGMISKLYNEPINRLCAITGELDVLGNIKAIGGLHSKIQGAKLAGVSVIIYPKENQNDITIISKEDPQCIEDMNLIPISRIDSLINKALVNPKNIKNTSKK
mgnify:CR=1 FL=1